MAGQGKTFEGHNSFQQIQSEQLNPKLLWDRACQYDGIDPGSKFVVFSDSNPWVEKYNKAMQLYLMAEKYYREHRSIFISA